MSNARNGPDIRTFRWLGSDAPHLDRPFVARCGDVVIGCYGGNSSAGARKNEDAALVWCATDEHWTFAALLDAHATSQSAELILDTLDSERQEIIAALSLPLAETFPSLQRLLIRHFVARDFGNRCRTIRGETACLICAQKEQFVWWLSIGDCLVYVLHPELARMGQYTLNQRSFYEWVGRANTFALPVPCYSSGTRELRQGHNHIVMVTDGLLECGTRPFEDPRYLYDVFTRTSQDGVVTMHTNVQTALERVHQEKGRDSASLVCWTYDNGDRTGARPTG